VAPRGRGDAVGVRPPPVGEVGPAGALAGLAGAREQHLRLLYPDGVRVVCVATALLVDGLIVRQLVAQAWDSTI
jgi:hypothetical protein